LKIGIINVGVNTSHRKLRSPIFEDGTFEFVPIPRCSPSVCPDEPGNCLECIEEYTVFPRYCELPSPNGREFSEFIPSDRLKMRTDNDPEFQTFSYGDFPSRNSRASYLKKLDSGDRLFFLARLVKWSGSHFTNEAGFYLIGFFEIEYIFDEYELADMVKSRRFDEKFDRIKNNGHMLMAQNYPKSWFNEIMGWERSWVFTGSNRSRRFTYAVPVDRELVSEVMRDAEGRDWTWPENQTELQRIGSYTRSCRIIEDKSRIEKLYKAVEMCNPDVKL